MKIVKIPHPKKDIKPIVKPKTVPNNRIPLESFRAYRMSNRTDSELLFQKALSKTPFNFYPEYILDGLILDFFLPDYGVIIELDGKWCHNKAKDAQRDQKHKNLNFRTLRIKSSRIFWDLDDVMEQVRCFVLKINNQPKNKISKRKKKAKRKEKRKLFIKIQPKEDEILSQFHFACSKK